MRIFLLALSCCFLVCTTLKAGYADVGSSSVVAEVNNGNSGTAQTIDFSKGPAQLSTLTGNVTYTFSNAVSGGAYVLRVATGAGGFSITWPAAVKWASGTAPIVTSAGSKSDLYNFYYDGTNFYGSSSLNY